MADYNFLLENRLSQDQQLTLQMLEGLCRAHGPRSGRGPGLNLYLTGGAMRDLVAGQPVRSLEITTEGDPAPLAAALQQAGVERLDLPEEPRGVRFTYRGVRVRMAAARTAAGADTTIVEALRHRGLTLNSIGLSLNAASRALPLDPANGIGDIEARLIRMNDAYVFYENPIVLLRALRLQVRMGFALEERTAARLAAAQEGHYLEQATPAARGQELEAIAYQPNVAGLLRELEAGGWLEAALGKGVRGSKMQLGLLERLPEAVESWQSLGLTVDPGTVALWFMLGRLAAGDQSRLTRWLPNQRLREWKQLPAEARRFEAHWLKAVTASGAWMARGQEVIEHAPAEAVVLASLEPHDARAGKRLREFQAAAQALRARIPLGLVRSLGLAPRSQRTETMLQPLYRRLLAGETLSEGEIAAAVRAVVEAAAAPAAVVTPPSKPAKARKAVVAAAPTPARTGARAAAAAKKAPVAKAVKTVAPRAGSRPAAHPSPPSAAATGAGTAARAGAGRAVKSPRPAAPARKRS